MALLLVTILLQLHLCLCSVNNVCKTYASYSGLKQNSDCWYNPDVGATPAEISNRYGYSFESHQVTAPDGFLLTLFRISSNSTSGGTGVPVLLHHGLGLDGSSWLIQREAPGFYLADQGCDVWIMNVRGTRFSSQHLRLNSNQKQFWNFSFHEMALIDLPVVVEYIAARTGKTGKIVYIGHSLGGAISYVYASTMPEHAKRHLKKIISLAPAGYLTNVNGLQKGFYTLLYPLLQTAPNMGIYGIGQNLETVLRSIRSLCNVYPYILVCAIAEGIVLGINSNEILPEEIPLLFHNNPAIGSIKNLMHLWQISTVFNRFQLFDYGTLKNLQLYNSTIPPEYDVLKIDVPVHVFYGRSDFLTHAEDVVAFSEKLRTKRTIMPVLEGERVFDHLDFVTGKYTKKFYELLSSYIIA